MTRRRVLIADDNPVALDQTRRVLEAKEYEVLVASDGVSAINTTMRENPDVVILDVIMPQRNGFQVCRELRLNQMTRDVPIVMLSSSPSQSGRFWGLDQGATEYLVRPFDDDALLSCLERVLEAATLSEPADSVAQAAEPGNETAEDVVDKLSGRSAVDVEDLTTASDEAIAGDS